MQQNSIVNSHFGETMFNQTLLNYSRKKIRLHRHTSDSHMTDGQTPARMPSLQS